MIETMTLAVISKREKKKKKTRKGRCGEGLKIGSGLQDFDGIEY